MKTSRVLFPILLLIAASLACSLLAPPDAPESSEEAREPAPGPTQVPDNVSPPETENPPTLVPSLNSGEPFELDSGMFTPEIGAFNTYRASLNYTFTNSEGVTGTITMEEATQVEPPASSLTFETGGRAAEGTGGGFTYVLVDNIEYISSPEIGCQGGVTNFQIHPFELLLDTGEVLTGQAQYIGEETVNGVETLVYGLTSDNLAPADPAGLGIETLSEGRLFIAKIGGFLVRVTLNGVGTNAGLSGDPDAQGSILYELNFFDFDQPVSIDVPEGCTSPGETTQDLPLPDDAGDVTRFVDFVSFTTSQSMEELVVLYENEMPSFGCSAPEVIGDGSSMTAMTFNDCSFGTAQIVMTVEQTGETSATIFITP